MFGRVENERAVTASNLFKVCQPGHAVVIFKRVHDPLAFRCACACSGCGLQLTVDLVLCPHGSMCSGLLSRGQRVSEARCILLASNAKAAFRLGAADTTIADRNPAFFHVLSAGADVLDLLSASHEWFSRALGHITGPSAGAEPLLLWNCLPRAGASQFHGHAQLLLTEV